MYAPLLPAPNILTLWRRELNAALDAAGIDAAVGPKRPADTTNLQGNFVRIMCLGGPWRYRNLWYPRLAAESWAPSVAKARELDAIVGLATRRMEGLRAYFQPLDPSTPAIQWATAEGAWADAIGPWTTPQKTPGVFISSCELDIAGSDMSYEGAPFVLTTTEPLCVQVTLTERSAP